MNLKPQALQNQLTKAGVLITVERSKPQEKDALSGQQHHTAGQGVLLHTFWRLPEDTLEVRPGPLSDVLTIEVDQCPRHKGRSEAGIDQFDTCLVGDTIPYLS